MLVPLLPLAAMALPLCRLFSCARDALHGNSSHGVALAGAVDARHGVLVRGGPWRGAAACPRLSLGKFLEMGSGVRYHHRCRSGGGGVMHACKLAVPDMSRLIRRVPRVETRRTTNLFLQQ